MSEWTVDSLKHHLEALYEAMDNRYSQRFTDQQKAVDAALQSAEKAVAKAETASERRFMSTLAQNRSTASSLPKGFR